MKPNAVDIDQRFRHAIAQARLSAWALRPETLSAIGKAARGEILVEDLEEHARPQAARGPVSTGGVDIIQLRGLITPRGSFFSMLFGGGGGLEAFRQSLRESVGNDDITAIVLDIDSPGGSTDLVAEAAADIRAARTVKPVIAVANVWAASAAYWLASQADELVVTPSGEVGSIGVFMVHEDWSKFNEELGVDPTYISAGKYKAEANFDQPLTDEARQALQDKVDEFYGLFVADVAKGRGVAPSAVRNGFGEGRMVSAKQAVNEKLADRIDTLEATIARVVRNPGRARRAEDDPNLTPQSEGNPELNPSAKDGEEAKARPSESYIDLMFDPTR